MLKYTRHHVASMWHWHNSVALGKFVSPSDFRFMPDHFERLSVVDASVMPQLPRLNPLATFILLGRYAGLIKRRIRRRANLTIIDLTNVTLS